VKRIETQVAIPVVAHPSGVDSLLIREAYFRELRSRHFGDWAPITVSLFLVMTFVIVGLIGWIQ
jgi:hypothetical protein